MRGWGEKEESTGITSQIISVTLLHVQLCSCIDMTRAHCELYHEGMISRVTSAGFNGEEKACDATS